MNGSPLWQSLAVLAIGVASALYLLKRWWPALRSLWQRPQAPSLAPSRPCASALPAPTSGSACSGGCSHCGSSGQAPARDHRVIPLQAEAPRQPRS